MHSATIQLASNPTHEDTHMKFLIKLINGTRMVITTDRVETNGIGVILVALLLFLLLS